MANYFDPYKEQDDFSNYLQQQPEPQAPVPVQNPVLTQPVSNPNPSTPTIPSQPSPADDPIGAILGNYNDSARQQAIDSGNDQKKKLSILEGIAQIGAGIAGRDPTSASRPFDARRAEIDANTTGAFDKARQGALEKYTLERQGKKNALEDRSSAEMNDPNSDISKSYQAGLASLTGKNPSVYAGQSAARLKEITPLAEKAAALQVEKEKIQASKDKGSGTNPYQKSEQEALGKASAEYKSKDRIQLVTNLDKIAKTTSLLNAAIKNGEPLSGAVRGRYSDDIRKITNPNAIIARDSIYSAIQDTLKPTLGAQFTEAEGERIKKLAYDPMLDDQENLRRAKQLDGYIRKKVIANDAMYSYLSKNKGSLDGFDYGKYAMQPVGDISAATPDQSSGGVGPGSIITHKNGSKYRVGEDGETLEPL